MVRKIEATKVSPRKLRVAAYARVSTGRSSQENSFSAQVAYFRSMIKAREDWDFSGVYADRGFTGTKADRPQFQKLLDEARKGNIDLIVTKSVSRFARNTVDLLNITRELKSIGVPVFFEKENLRTDDAGGELMLSLIASIAQAESISISENAKWGIRRKFEKGINHTNHLYGYRKIDGEFVIDEAEATVVRRIFAMYIEGKSPYEIADILTAEGVKSPSGMDTFIAQTVYNIVNNISYTGTMILQKYFITNALTKLAKKNRGELPMYRVEGALPAIIDEETFAKAQEMARHRSALGYRARKDIKYTQFSGKVRCAKCGELFNRRRGNLEASWICAGKYKQKKCDSTNVTEKVLLRFSSEITQNFEEDVDYISAGDGCNVTFHMKDGREMLKKWKRKANGHVVFEEDER